MLDATVADVSGAIAFDATGSAGSMLKIHTHLMDRPAPFG